MSTLAALAPTAPTSYWNLLHEARQLPPQLQAHLSQALAEGLAATTRHRAVITRDPEGSGDHKVMQVDVYSFSKEAPDPALVGTCTHTLSRPLAEPSYLFDPFGPEPAGIHPEAKIHTRDALTAARAAFPALLARTARVDAARARIGLDLLLELDDDARTDAALALARSLQ